MSEFPALLRSSIGQLRYGAFGPLAHPVEQGTFNPKVLGSRPRRPTPLTCYLADICSRLIGTLGAIGHGIGHETFPAVAKVLVVAAVRRPGLAVVGPTLEPPRFAVLGRNRRSQFAIASDDIVTKIAEAFRARHLPLGEVGSPKNDRCRRCTPVTVRARSISGNLRDLLGPLIRH